MKRKIYQNLLHWKNSNYRKPLIIKGARQVGKTFIINEFGHNEYDNFIYCNFENEQSLHEIFSGDLNPLAIIENIEKIKHQKIHPHIL